MNSKLTEIIVSDLPAKTKKTWKLIGEFPENLNQNLKSYSPLMRKLLARRGISNSDSAEKYLNPDYERDIHDPFLMLDMDKAVERILKAVESGEKVLIFGDYDADGVPASALLADFFKSIGFLNFEVYIPNRHTEQYGLSLVSIEKFAKGGTKLLITVDCGITNIEEVKKAGQLGVDVIITDHHLVPTELPPAHAVIDPKRPGDPYPEKMLSGTGVAFKLVQALIKKGNFNLPEGFEKWLLDLVAVATVSDMVPITGENRVLTHFGLKVLNKTRRLGLNNLFQALSLKKNYIQESDIAFLIGPRINSAGRMSHASQAYYLLVTDKQAEAETITRHLEEQNKRRRKLVTEIMEVAEKSSSDEEIMVIGNNDWNIGVLGLAAARLSEIYNKSVFVWAKNENGEVKGSCRSNGKIDVVELMRLANEPDLFLDFGGHNFAGGFSLDFSKLSDLSLRLNKAFKKLDQMETDNSVIIDTELELSQVNWQTYKEIEKLGPFGINNETPTFLFKDITVAGAHVFGKEKNHLKLTLMDEKNHRIKVSAISFFACLPTQAGENDKDEEVFVCGREAFSGTDITPGSKISMVASLEASFFAGRQELRLRIIDITEPYE